MQVEDDKGCFVCGDDNAHGLHATFEVDKKNQSASCHYTIPQQFQGWKNVAHGGILATLLDEVSIYACRSITCNVVTAELSVRYRKPVMVNTLLVLRAKIVETKKRYFLVESTIEVDGKVHASAKVKVFIC
ncbi:MAG: PaaI family thioesterase [Deltaproteobacteria bacterium]|nr:PaaI family thioesterase [Deltaproteobacteria bacterium]